MSETFLPRVDKCCRPPSGTLAMEGLVRVSAAAVKIGLLVLVGVSCWAFGAHAIRAETLLKPSPWINRARSDSWEPAGLAVPRARHDPALGDRKGPDKAKRAALGPPGDPVGIAPSKANSPDNGGSLSSLMRRSGQSYIGRRQEMNTPAGNLPEQAGAIVAADTGGQAAWTSQHSAAMRSGPVPTLPPSREWGAKNADLYVEMVPQDGAPVRDGPDPTLRSLQESIATNADLCAGMAPQDNTVVPSGPVPTLPPSREWGTRNVDLHVGIAPQNSTPVRAGPDPTLRSLQKSIATNADPYVGMTLQDSAPVRDGSAPTLQSLQEPAIARADLYAGMAPQEDTPMRGGPAPTLPPLQESEGVVQPDMERADGRNPFQEETAVPADAAGMERRPIGSVTTSILLSTGDLPENSAQAKFPAMRDIPKDAVFTRAWPGIVYQWEPSYLCHRPLYFEEVNLERYGYMPGGHYCNGIPAALVQPVLSGARFFATIPILPYKGTVEPPYECIYTLGHYRPGSPAPHQIHWMPLSPAAGGVEALYATALVFAIP